jgi:site-specific recombinase XerC
MTIPTSVAALLERFFTQRLMQQRQASPHTISSYRDTFRQFLNLRLARSRFDGFLNHRVLMWWRRTTPARGSVESV